MLNILGPYASDLTASRALMWGKRLTTIGPFADDSVWATSPPIPSPSTLVAWYSPANPLRQWKETGSAGSEARLTQSAVDGDAVGWLDDSGPYAINTRAATAPTLITAVGRSWISFTAGGDRLSAVDNKKAFKFLHSTSTWTLKLSCYFPTDPGSAYFLLDNSGYNSGSQLGISLRRTAANKLEIWAVNGADTPLDLTTTNVILSNAKSVLGSGGIDLVITRNGTAGVVTAYYGDGSSLTDSFTFPATAAGDSTYNLDFNCKASDGSGGGVWYMGETMFYSSVLSAGDIASLIAYKPTRQSVNVGSYFKPIALSYDWSDPTTLFTDTGYSAPVASDGDNIGSLFDKSGLGVNLGRGAASAIGTYAKYRTNIQNGLSAIKALAATAVDLQLAQPVNLSGSMEIFVVARNLNSVEGSQLWNGSGYALLYGSATTSGGGGLVTDERFGIHTASGPGLGISSLHAIQQWNIYCVSITPGGTLRGYCNSGSSPSGQNPITDTGVNQITDLLKQTAGAGMTPECYWGELLIYNTNLTAAQRAAEFARLKTKWGIA